MRGERGQITLFVIIGLLVLFVIGIFFLLSASRAREDDARAGTQGVIDAASAAAVSSAIASCLDAIMSDELKLLGETGALPSIDGYPSGIVPYATGARRVIYGVTRNRNEIQDPPSVTILPIAYDTPRYPDHDVTVELSDHYFDADLGRLVRFDWFQDGYFGDVNFPAICDVDGSNGPTSPFRCRSYPGMPPGTAGPSMEQQLRERVSQRMQSCASPRMLTDAIGQTITSIEAPRVNLTFTPNTILVTLTYRLDIEGTGTSTLTTTPRTYPVRLMPMLQYATALAREESRNASFNLTRDYERIQGWRPGFSILRTTASPTDKRPSMTPAIVPQADLITIIDTRSAIDGAAYPFLFLIEHRAPMLDPVLSEGVEERFTITANEVLEVGVGPAKRYVLEFDATAGPDPTRDDARLTILTNIFSRAWASPGANNIGTVGILQDGRVVFITKQTNATGQDYGAAHPTTFLEATKAWSPVAGKTYRITMTFDGEHRIQAYRITGQGMAPVEYSRADLPELAEKAGSKGLRVEFGIPHDSAGNPGDGEATARGWTFSNILLIGIGDAADPDDGPVKVIYCDGSTPLADAACASLGKSVVAVDVDGERDWQSLPTT